MIRSWPLTILSLCLLPILIGLGYWQLQRAEEKRQILADIDARLAAQPQNISSIKQTEIYTPVRLLGYYTDEYFYLDNRTRNGRAGYEVLQVFVSGEQRWLINRGWIAGMPDRSSLPTVSYPLAAKVITGFLYPVAAHTDNMPTKNPGAHGRIQQLDTGLTGEIRIGEPEWSIRLSADSDTALVTDWQLVNSNPQRHSGYAVQWFSMAAVLVILWLLAATNLRRKIGNGRNARDPHP